MGFMTMVVINDLWRNISNPYRFLVVLSVIVIFFAGPWVSLHILVQNRTPLGFDLVMAPLTVL
jgi:hypothetical protein